MTSTVSRRRFLASVGIATAGIALTSSPGAAAPPKETGLSSEGLLVGRPGFQPQSTMPLQREELAGFLSREQLALHHAEYVRLVERLQSTEEALRHEPTDAAAYADLRRTQVATANGVLLHELYFQGLSPTKTEVPRHIQSNMSEHMGPWESWLEDFQRCALAAKAWAVLVYDPYDDRWHDVVMNSDDDGVWIGGNPLVVCDVADYAFSRDYGRREDYVGKFLDHIDWDEVSRRYRAVDRM